jgi:hypothetical protein
MSGAALNRSRAGNRDNVLLGVVVAIAVAIACLAVVGTNWPWTGFKGNETLWDWLSVLVTPLAIASLPVRIAMPGHLLVRRWRLVWPALALVAAIIIAGGYGLGWTWTGFANERLWDWLHLLLLPAVLVFLPEWYAKGTPVSRVGGAVSVVLLVAFVLVIAGGYGGHWYWTGFQGNTFRDWLDLLIAPFLLPAACRWFQVTWAQRTANGVADGPASDAAVEAPEVTDTAELPETAEVTETAELPETAKIPTTAEIPKTAEVIEVAAVAGAAEVPEATGTAEEPGGA